MVEDGVGVDKDAGLVFFENLGDDGRLLPRGTTILILVNGNVVILVSVNLGCAETKLAA